MDIELEASFLRSAMTLDNPWMSLSEFHTWFAERRLENHFQIEQIPLAALDKWYFEKDTGNLVHDSGKFFRIEGVKVHCDKTPIQKWSEPLIHQPEIGILGLITRVVNGVRYFLMQAKMEPGNVNVVQLSPTVQATKSNFTQAHKGKRPLFVEYFLERNKSIFLIDQIQSEQGSRFIRKRNRNLVIQVTEELEIGSNFCWLTLGQIKSLGQFSNLVNMDTRSILSAVDYLFPTIDLKFSEKKLFSTLSSLEINPLGLSEFGQALLISNASKRNQLLEIQSWLADLKMQVNCNVQHIPLHRVECWKKGEMDYAHYSGHYQSIVAVKVEAQNREVESWSQPLLKPSNSGVNGLLCQRRENDILHFLIQARFEPGYYDLYELAPTVSCTQGKNSIFEQCDLPYEAYFRDPNSEQIRHRSHQSTEGGRFFKDENTYLVVELNPDDSIEIESKYYRWMTLGQILSHFPFGNFVNIELRELLACLDLLVNNNIGCSI